LSLLLAEAYVVMRLAAMGIVVRRISGQAALWSGFALAGIGVVIAALEVMLTHSSQPRTLIGDGSELRVLPRTLRLG
jgi:hypothetical protein